MLGLNKIFTQEENAVAASMNDLMTAFESNCLGDNPGFHDAHIPGAQQGFNYAPVEIPVDDNGVPIITKPLTGPGLECCQSGVDAFMEKLSDELSGG